MSRVMKGKVDGLTQAEAMALSHEDGMDVFVHYSAIQIEGDQSLEEGEEVEFEI